MRYYTEGVIKNASIADGTFCIAPRREYEREEGGKKLLLAVEENAVVANETPPFQALLLSETNKFSFSRHICPLIIAASSKTSVGVKFEIKKNNVIKSPIVISNLVVL